MAGLPQAGVELIAAGAKAFAGDLDAGEKAVKSFVGATEHGSKGVSAFGQIAIGALRQVGVAAVQAAAEGAKAIGAFVVDSIKQAGNFESGMLRFGSVTGDAIAEAGMALEDFSALFLQLGADTQFSAAQAQEAAINLAKGGLTPAMIAGGALADTLQLAAAGELELATAADITAKQLGVWADQGVTSANVANLLAQAANASVVSVEELALGMANVGGVAKLAGASFQDTVTALGAVSAGFSSAADAGTSMKAFLQKLQPATKPAIAAFRELNLLAADGSSKFYDAQGNFVGFSKAAELLKGSLDGLTKAQQTQLLQTIFGADGIRVAALLAEKGAAGFDAFAASMGATGTAAEQAAAKNKGFNFALETLMGSLDTLKVVLGTAILPMLTAFVTTALTPGINAVMAFAQSFFALVPAIQASSDPINTFFNALRVTLPEAVPLIGMVQTAFETLVGTALVIGAAAQTLAEPWIAAFSSIVPAVQGAIGQIEGIVTSVIGTIQGTTTGQLAAMQAAFMTAWAAIAETTGQYWNAILGIVTPILSNLSTFIQANGADIRTFFVDTWVQIAGVISTSMQLIQATVIPVLQTVGAYIGSHGAEIQTILSAAWNIIKTVISSTLAIIQGVISTTLAVVRGDWQGAWTELLGVGTTISSAISDVVGNLGVLLISQFALMTDQSVATMMKSVSNFVRAGEAMIQGVIQGVKSAAGALYGAVGQVISDAVAAAQSALASDSPSRVTADEIGEPFSQGIAAGIMAGAGEIQTVASGLMTGLVSSASGIVAGIKTSTAAAGVAISSGFEQKADDAKDAGGDISGGLAKGIKSGQSSVISAAISVARAAIEGAKSALGIASASRKSAQEVGVPLIQGIVKGMQDSFGLLKSMAKVLSKNLTEVMKNIALAAVKSFREVLTQGLQAEVDLAGQDISNIDAISGLTGGSAEATARAKKEHEDALADQAQSLDDYRQDQADAQNDYTKKYEANQLDINNLIDDQNDAIAEVMATTDFAASKEEKIAAIKEETGKKITKLQTDQAELLTEYATRLDAIQAEYNANRIEQAAAVQAAYTEFVRLQNVQIRQTQIAIAAQAELDAAAAASEETRKTNAVKAAQDYALASKQIADRARLQADLVEAQSKGDMAEIAALMEKISITEQLQRAQRDLLTQQQSGQTSPLEDTLKQLTDLQTALQREVQLDRQRAKDTADRNKRVEREAEAAQSQVALDQIVALISQVQAGIGVGTGQAITATLSSALEQAVAQAQQILGIHSPSTVFAKKVGQPAGAGVVQGFASMLPQLGTVLAKSVAAPQMVSPVQTSSSTSSRSYTDASTLNAPMNITSNASVAQIEAVVNRVLDRRTGRASATKATGGY